MSGRYEVSFLERRDCGADVITSRFEKPDGYTFTPGQYLTLRLQTAEGEQTKPFTHAQAPRDDYLELTTRLSGSAFKEALRSLAPGQPVTIAGPSGRMALPEGVDTVAFLVGGVGITPARSMLRDSVQRGFVWKDAVVFFGNRDRSCMPYAEELGRMSPSGVRVVHVLERVDAEWEGYTGLLTADVVRENVDPADGRIFCVSGPPMMVSAMERVLDDLGIEDERRLIERFGAG